MQPTASPCDECRCDMQVYSLEGLSPIDYHESFPHFTSGPKNGRVRFSIIGHIS